MTDLQINEEVLTAYLRGELNAAEAAAVEAWYDASAANRRLLGEIYYILYVNDRSGSDAHSGSGGSSFGGGGGKF